MSERPTKRPRGTAPVGVDHPPRVVREESGDSSGGNMRGRGGYSTVRQGPLQTRPANVDPSQCAPGKEIGLFTNYFKWVTAPETRIWDYRIEFDPPEENSKSRRMMVLQHANSMNKAYIFDGDANLKTMTVFPEEVTTFTSKHPTTGADVQVTFARKNEISWGSFEMIRHYNTTMRTNLRHLNMALMGNWFYDVTMRRDLPNHNISIIPGMATAVNIHEAGILLNCDQINKVIHLRTVYDVLMNCRSQASDWKPLAEKALIGKIVVVTYNNRTYRVDGIEFSKNPLEKFERRGVLTTIKDYLENVHAIKVRDDRQPLLLSRPSVRQIRDARNRGWPEPTDILLVPEFCCLTGLTDDQRRDSNLKKEVTQTTQLDPMARFNGLMQFKDKLAGNEKVGAEMAKFNIQFESGLMSVKGRQMAGETIYMGNNREVSFDQNKGDFSKEIRSHSMYEAQIWSNWAIIFVRQDKPLIDDFLDNMKKVCGPLGIRIPGSPKNIYIDDERGLIGSYVDALKEARDCDMVVAVVPNDNKDRYDTIKKICYCDDPKSSQVILRTLLTKKQMLMSIATKVAIQMACKSGSIPWTVKIPSKQIMVCGYDVCHHTTNTNQSVGGFVCTLNDSLSTYFSKVDFHGKNEEISSSIGRSFEEGLRAYQKANCGQLPAKIVFYRDGVGEGDIKTVFEYEVKQLEQTLKKVGGDDCDVQLAFVIVTKRIGTRFMMKLPEKRLGNPPPGTIVDKDVVRPERYEFFLVSQSVRHGTVCPTNFNIIHNTTTFPLKVFQILSYKLTHTYYNWMGTVRVPAPVQNAHKLAFMVATHLHREPHPQLSDKLFYL